MIGVTHYVALSFVLFAVGITGVLIRRNLLTVLMSIELILNAANLNLIAFSRQLGDLNGQLLAVFVITLAAGEAAIGLAIIIYGYGQYHAHELIQVWSPPAFMRHITEGLMLFAVIFFTAAFIPSHIKAKLKHPMLAGVKTWALAHLLSNGDLGSILLFGAFLAWGVYARIAAKRRGEQTKCTAPA